MKKLVQLHDNDSLDYSRYGDVFGEVILAGNIVEPGGSLRSAPTPHCVFESETEEKATIGVEAMHQIMRRKPFLRARFDAVVSKLLICLSTFGDVERDRFAFAVGLMLSRNMVRCVCLSCFGHGLYCRPLGGEWWLVFVLPGALLGASRHVTVGTPCHAQAHPHSVVPVGWFLTGFCPSPSRFSFSLCLCLPRRCRRASSTSSRRTRRRWRAATPWRS